MEGQADSKWKVFFFQDWAGVGVGNLEEVCLLKKRNEWVEMEKLKV